MTNLTPRELQVVELVAKEYLDKEIVDELGISHGSVRKHLKNAIDKLDCKSRVGLAVIFVTSIRDNINTT